MNVLIIGCGYLGSVLAKLWKERGYHVTATTRSPTRLDSLSRVCQKGVILRGTDVESLAELMPTQDLVLVTIGADDASDYENAYLKTARAIRAVATELPPKHLIYTSSTAVYGDLHGLWVDETTPPNPKSEQAKILLETEEVYLSLVSNGWKVTLFRLGEIYGPDRELKKRMEKLQGQTLPGSGDLYSNMIHRDDAASAIDYAFRHHLTGIYNLADDEHPTRKALYQELAQIYKIAPPNWDPELPTFHSGNKRVSNHKIKGEGFAFIHSKRAH
jgi:nucleoside-diphosphate-sugar epimerase